MHAHSFPYSCDPSVFDIHAYINAYINTTQTFELMYVSILTCICVYFDCREEVHLTVISMWRACTFMVRTHAYGLIREWVCVCVCMCVCVCVCAMVVRTVWMWKECAFMACSQYVCVRAYVCVCDACKTSTDVTGMCLYGMLTICLCACVCVCVRYL